MPVMLGAGGKVLLGPGGKVATNSACCCGGCPCNKTVTITVTFSVDDTSAGCDFHASKTETLVSGDAVNLCAHGWGPFEFDYIPEFDNGQIFINNITAGLSGPDPPPICFSTDGICGVFTSGGCGSGYLCFTVGDAYYTGDPSSCFTVCNPPGTINWSWYYDTGFGLIISASVTITII